MQKRLLLVGWDAADWKVLKPLMDAGKMPTLRDIVEGGASGSMLCAQPLVPAAQWTSLMTGKRPWQHRVCQQGEWDAKAQRGVPVSAAQRQSIPLWEILARSGRRSLVVGWPATHGSRGEEVTIVSNRYAEPTAGPGIKPWPPAIAGTYWPEQAGSTLDRLRVSPEDVQADLIAHLVPDWRTVDQKRDRRLGHLRVFLATDLSYHAAMMELLKSREWEFAVVNFPALGAITAMFLPYLAPRREWVAEQEFRLYQQVLPSACIVLDRMLRALLQAAGEDTAVVVASAHGVNPHPPPHFHHAKDNEIWKSPYGVFAFSGPGCSHGSRVLGATLQDVAPTVLGWFGLPIGDDMEGRVLVESFTTPPEVKRVPSWETNTQPSARASEPASSATPNHPAVVRFNLDYDWNLARFYLDAARYEEASPRLEKLFRAFPERPEFGHVLFQCQLTLKQTAAAADTLEVLLEAIPPGVWPLLLRAELLIAQGQPKDARSVVDEIHQLKPTDAQALRRLGMLFWRLREWNALAELAEQSLAVDTNEPLAWLARAEASLRLGRASETVEAAQRAIGLNYFLPQAHLALSRGLLKQGKWAEARDAMQAVLRLQPENRAVNAYWRRSGLEKGRAPS